MNLESVAKPSDDSKIAKEGVEPDPKIRKAAKFWRHSSMASVSSTEKTEYLKAKGFTTEEIYQVWEHLVEGSDETEQKPSIGSLDNAAKNTTVPWNPTPTPSPQQQSCEEETSQQRLALLTVGGMIGLTAAAGVRWLNGGDFTLFPPPTLMGKELEGSSPSDLTAQTSSNDDLQMKNENLDATNEEDTVAKENISFPSDATIELSEQVKEIRSLVQEQSRSQDKILTHLTMKQTKNATDKSMELLRKADDKNGNTGDSTSLIIEEVKDLLLQQLTENETSQSSKDTYIQKALQKIENYQKGQGNGANISNNSHSNSTDDNLNGVLNPSHVTNANDDEANDDYLEDGFVDSSTSLKIAIQRLATENNADESALQSGCQVLYLYVLHLSSNPHVPRYRKIYTSNDNFRKVELIHGGMDLLLAVGFVKDEGCLEWKPEDEDVAIQCLREASAALTILKSNNADSIKELSTITIDDVSNKNGVKGVGSSSSHLQTPEGSNLLSPPNTKKQMLLPTPELFPDTPQQKQQRIAMMDDSVKRDENIDEVSSDDAGVSPKRFFFESSSPVSGAFQPVSSEENLSSHQPCRDTEYSDFIEPSDEMYHDTADQLEENDKNNSKNEGAE